jgi:short-subunit dehydrogenase
MKNMKEPVYTLITGASSGIGKSIAWYCGSLGMNLILVSLPNEGLNKVAGEIAEKHKVKTLFFETDLTRLEAPQEVFTWTQFHGLNINILVNNAGVAGASVFEFSEIKYIDDRILLNIRALVMLSRLFLPLLRTNDKSYILNVGSLAAFWPIPYKSLYSSSKAFVVSFSQSIRSELKGSGVSVSVLCPNGVRTNGATHVRINSHGRMGRLTELSADVVARAGINGMLKGKFVIVPGRINSFVLMFGRIFPESMQQRFLVREFGKEIHAK